MKKYIFAASFAVLGILPAAAADFPVVKAAPYATAAAAAYSWTGFYLGINGGWIGSNDDTATNVGTDTNKFGLGSALNAGLIPTSVGGLGNSGGMVGGTAGYNWQASTMVVVGLEGDIDWVSAKAATTSVFAGNKTVVPFSEAYNRQLDWLATFRGRAGILVAPSLMIYGTGGLAVGEVKVGNQFICAKCGPPASTETSTTNTNTSTAVGWTVGAGAEWKFAPAWSLKAEYLYADLGNHSSTIVYTYGKNTSSLTSTVHDAYNMARVGINYHF